MKIVACATIAILSAAMAPAYAQDSDGGAFLGFEGIRGVEGISGVNASDPRAILLLPETGRQPTREALAACALGVGCSQAEDLTGETWTTETAAEAMGIDTLRDKWELARKLRQNRVPSDELPPGTDAEISRLIEAADASSKAMGEPHALFPPEINPDTQDPGERAAILCLAGACERLNEIAGMNNPAEVQLAYGLSDQDVKNIREHLRNPPRSNYGFSATPEEAAALKEHFEDEGMSFTAEEVLGSEDGQSADDPSEGVDMTELADIERIKKHFSDGVCNAVDEGYTFTASPDAPWSPTLGDFAGKDRNWRRLWGPTPEASADFLLCTGANICKRTYERFSGLELRVQAEIDLPEAVAALIETEWSENFFTREQFEAYRGAQFEAKAQSSAGVTFSGYHSDLVCLYPGPQNYVTQGPEHFNDGAPIRLSGSAGEGTLQTPFIYSSSDCGPAFLSPAVTQEIPEGSPDYPEGLALCTRSGTRFFAHPAGYMMSVAPTPFVEAGPVDLLSVIVWEGNRSIYQVVGAECCAR